MSPQATHLNHGGADEDLSVAAGKLAEGSSLLLSAHASVQQPTDRSLEERLILEDCELVLSILRRPGRSKSAVQHLQGCPWISNTFEW